MEIFENAAPPPPGATWAIGNFDGVHRGHRGLFDAARNASPGAPLGVLTFEPHPRRLFRPDDPPFRLTTRATKRRLMADAGVAYLLEMRFDATLAAMPAAVFVKDVLIGQLKPSALVTGSGFRFGKGRTGDVALLKAIAESAGVSYAPLTPLGDAARTFSSTRVRSALAAGDLSEAYTVLGRFWTVDGLVSEGDRRGRTIGFPTINVPMDELVEPKAGVYAVEVQLDGEERWRGGVANLGARPTVDGEDFRLEAHLFDFGDDVYGRGVIVRLLHFIRAERRFDGLDALKAQIAEDADVARGVLAVRARTTAKAVEA